MALLLRLSDLAARVSGNHRFIFLNKSIYLFLAALGFRCGTRASHCGGFPCCRARALGAWVSVAVAHGLSSCGLRALERRLSNWGTRV